MTRARTVGSGEHAERRTTGRVRILCVEDDELLRDGLTRRLEDKYDVSTAGSGVEALKIIAKSPPFAVVLSDMEMPDMTGVEFLSQVKHAVRILLTGRDDLETAVAAINVGRVHRFLTKPCNPSDLLDTIEDALATAEEADPQLEEKLREAERLLSEARGLARIGALARNESLALSGLSLLAKRVATAAEARMRKRKPLEECDLAALNDLAQRLRRSADSLAGFSVIATEEKAAAVERASLVTVPRRPAIVPAIRRPRPSLPGVSRNTIDPLDLLESDAPPSRGSESSPRESEIYVDVDVPEEPDALERPRIRGANPPRRSRPTRADKPPPAGPRDPGRRR